MGKLKEVVVIYHAQCRDGFGSAYAAWKRFGNEASYVPLKNQVAVPDGLTDKEIYILDYSFSKETLEELLSTNKKVIVVDHHKTAEEAVTSFPDNIFDLNHSGAVLSWKYFHPNTPVPPLLEYIEDHDLWNKILPNNREYNAALGQFPTTFKDWDKLILDLENDSFLEKYLERGRTVSQFEDDLVENLLQYREKVLFEGHEIYAINVSRTYRSILGHRLSQINKEEGGIAMGIVYYHAQGKVSISLRSEGDVDVREMAEKHGGGGHKNAASIKVATFRELPFTFV